MLETMSEHLTDGEHLQEDEHLMDSEVFQKGGRDTVLLVWTLAALTVIGFLMAVAAVSGT